jgi:hypothetical protein
MSKDITQNVLSDREALLPEADHVFTELTGLKMLFSPLHHRVATSPSLNCRNRYCYLQQVFATVGGMEN